MREINSMSDRNGNKPSTVADMLVDVRARLDTLDQFIEEHDLGEAQRKLFVVQLGAEFGALSALPQDELFDDVFGAYSMELTRRLNVGRVQEGFGRPPERQG